MGRRQGGRPQLALGSVLLFCVGHHAPGVSAQRRSDVNRFLGLLTHAMTDLNIGRFYTVIFGMYFFSWNSKSMFYIPKSVLSCVCPYTGSTGAECERRVLEQAGHFLSHENVQELSIKMSGEELRG